MPVNITWKMINNVGSDIDKHYLWKMIEQEPGVYKIQSLGTNGYFQVTESADCVK